MLIRALDIGHKRPVAPEQRDVGPTGERDNSGKRRPKCAGANDDDLVGLAHAFAPRLPDPSRVAAPASSGQRARLSDTVVWLPGVEGAVRAATPSMSSRNKRFDPHVLVVARGAEVTFPNVDPVYHNVFSLSPGNAFDHEDVTPSTTASRLDPDAIRERLRAFQQEYRIGRTADDPPANGDHGGDR